MIKRILLMSKADLDVRKKLHSILSCHSQLRMGLRRRRAFGMKSQFEVVDDSVHCGIIVDESDDENLRMAEM